MLRETERESKAHRLDKAKWASLQAGATSVMSPIPGDFRVHDLLNVTV